MLLKLDTIFTYSSLDFYDNFLHMWFIAVREINARRSALKITETL